jgi:ribosome-binding protein aMBF1 (putative translation factor)
MKRKSIPVERAFRKWRKDPNYRKAYDALEGEFALARTFVAARARAGLTQAEVARRMGTTQAVIARLESGRVKPSARTLERFAAATGHRLRIEFEPARGR